jgi:hypothetical protein
MIWTPSSFAKACEQTHDSQTPIPRGHQGRLPSLPFNKYEDTLNTPSTIPKLPHESPSTLQSLRVPPMRLNPNQAYRSQPSRKIRATLQPPALALLAAPDLLHLLVMRE